MANEVIVWIDAYGMEHILTNQADIAISIGPSGRYMPPIEHIEDEVPFQAGSILREIKVKAREMDFPVEINGKTQMDIRNKLRELLRIFNPLKGDGKIKSISPDGSQREIVCRYKGGLEIKESGRIWERFVLVLKAFDPFWYDTTTNVQTFSPGQPATFFPFLPLRLTSSSVFADVTINNLGDVETWPEWIVKGPGENIVLRNMTTGEITHLETSLEVGESLIINTMPYVKTVIKNDGTNLYSTLTDDSSLWALQDGQNSIRIEMSNTTNGSSVQLSYRNRYWGP
ncbi:phage distal tail protein [Bacillus sp. UNC322MFChir4.1]|uniref:phage distal tail protein n=1 Tax=Bacillus sp. UNC322MFChir4.1 TaxID=1449045 RepID=UPI00054DB9B6|nr:phage tail domain-containing protein [Bacillus sp. UNC322MFChir4.1]